MRVRLPLLFTTLGLKTVPKKESVLAPTASVIMVEPVCRTREVSRDYGSVACTRFPTEVLGAGIYLWVNGFDQRCIPNFTVSLLRAFLEHVS
jgi:hypothetical protein